MNAEYLKTHALQPRDIVIVGDVLISNLRLGYIKKLLSDAQVKTCTVTEQQEGTNEVAICYSSDIASLEWPVVFHVSKFKENSLYYRHFSLPDYFSIHDFDVIISRCMVQYVVIY